MRTQARLFTVGGMMVGLATWLIAAADSSSAVPPDGPQAEIRKIAEALQKDDMANAKSMAKALSEKAEMEDIMHMFSLRTSKGEGVGQKAGAIKPDGIEAKLQNLTKRVAPAELKNDGEALQRMAYISAAIAETVIHKAPKERIAEKDPAKWKEWCEAMSKAGVDLGKEIKAGDPNKVKAAAIKLDNTCKECHGTFRDT